MTDILQRSVPYDVFSPRPLPGIAPLDMADWLVVDDAYGGQLAEKARLLDERRADVLQMAPEAVEAGRELLRMVLDQFAAGAPAGFDIDEAAGQVTRPDGAVVRLDWDAPLLTLGQMVQEDICILQKQGDEHVLTAALLCFPASWRLAEKFMQPLTVIHVPVGSYTDDIARRVQRLFDGVRPGRPLWRFNALWYRDPTLYQPRSAHGERDAEFMEQAGFMRSEKQCILRLPKTGAVVFSIHTFVVARADLSVPESDRSEVVG